MPFKALSTPPAARVGFASSLRFAARAVRRWRASVATTAALAIAGFAATVAWPAGAAGDAAKGADTAAERRPGDGPARQALLAPVSNLTALPVLRKGASGTDVARVQTLLGRAWFSPGQIDGRFGRNVEHAVQAFQRAAGLPPSGEVDAATWEALGADRVPAFAAVTLREEDVRGPFVKLPEDVMARAKLQAQGYESAAEAIAERFHSSPRLLHEMNPGARFVAGAEWIVPNVAVGDASAADGVVVAIDKSRRELRAVDASGRTLAAFPISIGGPRDPLPVGQMRIVNEVEDPSFTYDPKLLKSAPAGAKKAQLAPGPNNPVGSMWLGLSKPHWGIHGTPHPEKLGRLETNGCVHLANWDIARLSKLVGAGTVVEVRE